MFDLTSNITPLLGQNSKCTRTKEKRSMQSLDRETTPVETQFSISLLKFELFKHRSFTFRRPRVHKFWNSNVELPRVRNTQATEWAQSKWFVLRAKMEMRSYFFPNNYMLFSTMSSCSTTPSSPTSPPPPKRDWVGGTRLIEHCWRP